jgi:alpha-glucosidase
VVHSGFWHIHAAERVKARLYQDAGEGYGEARLTRLSGGLSGDRFVLERSTEGSLPLARDTETLRVYGLPAPKEVVGAREHRLCNGALELTVDAGWRWLEVRL